MVEVFLLGWMDGDVRVLGLRPWMFLVNVGGGYE